MSTCLIQSHELTGNTTVSGLEVHGELSEARSSAEKVTVWYGDVTRRFAGTCSVDVVQHVRVTADSFDSFALYNYGISATVNALANTHASKSRSCHDDDITMTTSGTERLQLTVLDHCVCIYVRRFNE